MIVSKKKYDELKMQYDKTLSNNAELQSKVDRNFESLWERNRDYQSKIDDLELQIRKLKGYYRYQIRYFGDGNKSLFDTIEAKCIVNTETGVILKGENNEFIAEVKNIISIQKVD